MAGNFMDAEVWPEGSLEILSQFEVDQLQSSGSGGLYPLLGRCMLAVLNSDSNVDDARVLLDRFRDFEVGFIRQDRGLKVTLKNAPAEAFVDGRMIRGTRELLSAVLRDIGLPQTELPTALLFFNVGVEIGERPIPGRQETEVIDTLASSDRPQAGHNGGSRDVTIAVFSHQGG